MKKKPLKHKPTASTTAAVAVTALTSPVIASAQNPAPPEWNQTWADTKINRLEARAQNCDNPEFRNKHADQCWQTIRALNRMLKTNLLQEIQQHYDQNGVPTGMMFGDTSPVGRGKTTFPTAPSINLPNCNPDTNLRK